MGDEWCGVRAEVRGRVCGARTGSGEGGVGPPPPRAEFQDGRLLLQDGNHRYEALIREGAPDSCVLIYFRAAAERDRYLEEHPAVRRS